MSLGIAGVGILGCSIALRYRKVFPEHQVIGLDTSEQHLAFAREHDAITGVASDLRELARSVDILVLAVPIQAVEAMLATLVNLDLGDAAPRLILDVASVKAAIVTAANPLSQFIGTHPMAGSETSGPAAARADLFVGRTWAYIPSDNAQIVSEAREFILQMGACPVEIDAVTHDTIVARTSHLPQTLSTLLAVRALRESTHGVYGQGLLDMLRLAHSTNAVWNDIYIANADAIILELETYADELRAVAQAVRSGDRAALRDVFESANRLVEQGF